MENQKIFSSLTNILWPKNTETASTDQVINKENLPKLIEGLNTLLNKLESILANVYRDESGNDLEKQLDQLLTVLKSREARLSYLSGFFETTRVRIEAVQRDIEEHEKKIKEAEERKLKIDQSMKNLREKMIKRRKPLPAVKRIFDGTISRPFRWPSTSNRLTTASTSWTVVKPVISKKATAIKQPQDLVLKLEPLVRPTNNTYQNVENRISEEEEDEWDDLTDNDDNSLDNEVD